MKLTRFVCLFLLTAATLASGRSSAATSLNPIFLVPPSYRSGGNNTDAVALADVNGDGKMDMIVVNACPAALNYCISPPTGSVGVLLGNGDGTFQPVVVYHSKAQYASAIAIGDVNGDGKPDLIVSYFCFDKPCNSGALGVWLGKGDGTFQPEVLYGSGGFDATSVTVGDVNEDGKVDLLVAQCADSVCSSGTVGVLLGNGDGTFQKAVSFGAGGSWTSSVTVGDLNGDGKLDLVVTNNCFVQLSCSNTVGVLLGNGDASFQAAVTYPSGGFFASSAVIADVNKDGRPDLVVANACISDSVICFTVGGSVGVFLGNGDGTFQTPATYAAGVFGVSLLPGISVTPSLGLVVGDINGDGKADLILTGCELDGDGGCVTYGVGVLLGNGDGSFRVPVSYTLGVGGLAVAMGDLNGDGKPDVAVPGVCFTIGNCTVGGVTVLLGDGSGAFPAPISYPTATDVSPSSVAAADVNGDGKMDLLVASSICVTNGSCPSEASVLLGNGDGTFQPAVIYPSGCYGATSIAVADVNGDGKPDLLVTNSCDTSGDGNIGVLLGNGDGTFQPTVAYPSGGFNPSSIAVADVNGDGKPDLLVANTGDGSLNFKAVVSVLLGNGDGTFQQAVTYGPGGDYAASVAVADVNGDGKPDLLVGNCNTNNCLAGIGVLLGNGDGTFQPAVTYPSGTEAVSVAEGDVNGDGKPDLVVGDLNSVDVLLGNGDGTFQTATVITSPSAAPSYSNTVVLADFNGDGKLDIASSDGFLLLGNGNGTFQSFPLGIWGNDAAVGDFNGDGKPDLAIGLVTVLLNMSQQAPKVILNPLSLNFGNQTVGKGSAKQTVTLSNTGTATLNLSNIAANASNGSFTETNNCGTSVAAGASCAVTVAWIPNATGNMTGSLTFTDNAANSPQVVALSGAGVVPAVTLTPAKLVFHTQVVFTTSPSQTVTLTNTGLGILGIAKIGVTGPFLQTNNCGKIVSAGASCTFTVTFKPTTIGKSTGDISITDNAGNSPQTIALSGFGTYVQLAPTTLNFGNQAVGTKSLPKRVTLSNKGNVAVSITGISFTGTNATDFAETNTCGTSVAAGATCSITVTFTPSATGSRSATLSVTDDGGASPQNVSVAGAGT